MRLRLSDPTLVDEFECFLVRSGFLVDVEDERTVRVALPLSPGPTRDEAELRTLLEIWVRIGLRIWRDAWPEADAIVVPEPVRERTAA